MVTADGATGDFRRMSDSRALARASASAATAFAVSTVLTFIRSASTALQEARRFASSRMDSKSATVVDGYALSTSPLKVVRAASALVRWALAAPAVSFVRAACALATEAVAVVSVPEAASSATFVCCCVTFAVTRASTRAFCGGAPSVCSRVSTATVASSKALFAASRADLAATSPAFACVSAFVAADGGRSLAVGGRGRRPARGLGAPDQREVGRRGCLEGLAVHRDGVPRRLRARAKALQRIRAGCFDRVHLGAGRCDHVVRVDGGADDCRAREDVEIAVVGARTDASQHRASGRHRGNGAPDEHGAHAAAGGRNNDVAVLEALLLLDGLLSATGDVHDGRRAAVVAAEVNQDCLGSVRYIDGILASDLIAYLIEQAAVDEDGKAVEDTAIDDPELELHGALVDD